MCFFCWYSFSYSFVCQQLCENKPQISEEMFAGMVQRAREDLKHRHLQLAQQQQEEERRRQAAIMNDDRRMEEDNKGNEEARLNGESWFLTYFLLDLLV